jgi:hypothetical protein
MKCVQTDNSCEDVMLGFVGKGEVRDAHAYIMDNGVIIPLYDFRQLSHWYYQV